MKIGLRKVGLGVCIGLAVIVAFAVVFVERSTIESLIVEMKKIEGKMVEMLVKNCWVVDFVDGWHLYFVGS